MPDIATSDAILASNPGYVTDHTTHFYVLGGPDFIVGPDAPPAERNILGVIGKVGLDVGQAGDRLPRPQPRDHPKLGGRSVHPTAGLPGGWSKPVTEEVREEIEAAAAQERRLRALQPEGLRRPGARRTPATST